MTYKGESPSKKITRLKFWELVSEYMVASGVRLSLLSAEAGDISVQMGLGVSPGNLIGVDIDKHAAAAGQHKFKEAPCYHADVEDFMTSKPRTEISVAHLDYCSPMSTSLLQKTANVVDHMKTGGLIGCAFQAGREIGEVATEIMNATSHYPQHISFGSRAAYLAEQLMVLPNKQNRVVKPVKFFYYVSGKPGNHGVPMIVFFGTIISSTAKTQKAVNKRKNTWLKQAAYEIVSVDTKELTKIALALCDKHGPEKTCLLLNVKKMQLAAWRAHRTMGTYK